MNTTLVEPSESPSRIAVEHVRNDSGEWIVASIDGVEQARRLIQRKGSSDFTDVKLPFADACSFGDVYYVGRALDLASRRMRFGRQEDDGERLRLGAVWS
jgi:hypothetical protein